MVHNHSSVHLRLVQLNNWKISIYKISHYQDLFCLVFIILFVVIVGGVFCWCFFVVVILLWFFSWDFMNRFGFIKNKKGFYPIHSFHNFIKNK